MKINVCLTFIYLLMYIPTLITFISCILVILFFFSHLLAAGLCYDLPHFICPPPVTLCPLLPQLLDVFDRDTV